jgi:hypothetical protein
MSAFRDHPDADFCLDCQRCRVSCRHQGGGEAMTASELEWVADNPELVEAPRADGRENPAERVTAHECNGALELRSAERGEWITCATPVEAEQ